MVFFLLKDSHSCDCVHKLVSEYPMTLWVRALRVADLNTFSFLQDEESCCSSLLTFPASSKHFLRPSGLPFGLRHFNLFCLTWDPPSQLLPQHWAWKGTRGMNVNGTWLKKKKKSIYLHIKIKHAASFCTWICIFKTGSPKECPASFVSGVVIKCWLGWWSKSSMITKSSTFLRCPWPCTVKGLRNLCCSIQGSARLSTCNLDRQTQLCGFLLRPLESVCTSLTWKKNNHRQGHLHGLVLNVTFFFLKRNLSYPFTRQALYYVLDHASGYSLILSHLRS